MSPGELYRERGAVYALTSPQGTPFYVGATMQRVRERAMQHLRCARRGRYPDAPLYQLLAQTGRCGFWVLESGVEPEQLAEREAHHRELLAAAGFELLNRHHTVHYGGRLPGTTRAQRRRAAARRPRNGAGSFAPSLPTMAGAAPSPGELFMSGAEL